MLERSGEPFLKIKSAVVCSTVHIAIITQYYFAFLLYFFYILSLLNWYTDGSLRRSKKGGYRACKNRDIPGTDLTAFTG
jgi:hypothetical protein